MIVAAYLFALLACILFLAWLHQLERAETNLQSFKPTRRQLAQWKRERNRRWK